MEGKDVAEGRAGVARGPVPGLRRLLDDRRPRAEGQVSRSGFVASIVTGVVLVVITVVLVKVGWIVTPAKPAEIAAEDEP